MYKRAGYRVEYSRHSQDDREKIQAEGKGKVAFDRGHHSFREGQQMRQLFHLVVYQRNIRGIYGDIASHSPHCDADSRFFQGWSVVHAIPDHTDRLSRRLIGADLFQFVFRKTICMYLADMELLSDRLRGIFMVSRQKHRLNAEPFKGADHAGAFRTQCIGQREIARLFPAYGYINDRTPLFERLLRSAA